MTSTHDTLQAILDLHQPGVRGIDVGLDYCEECRKIYPCETARLATADLRGGDHD